MGILENIIVDKQREILLKKGIISVSQLEKSTLFNEKTISLSKRLRESSSGIITEHKRRSPSKPIINNSFSVEDVVVGYQNAGACGISVLTDGKYFGGSLDDLILTKATTNIPILRKDFVVDPYQIIESKAYGADVILLIAAVLNREQIKMLSELAQNLGMEVLLEVHDSIELENSIMPSINMIGVNNRNLKTFEVDIEISRKLSALIPNEFVKISESGIDHINTVRELRHHGYRGFLMGEHFMKTENPGKNAGDFIQNLTHNLL
jgi:indole-3-glycerol phosphate synthase